MDDAFAWVDEEDIEIAIFFDQRDTVLNRGRSIGSFGLNTRVIWPGLM
jgi:hypothetical protein